MAAVLPQDILFRFGGRTLREGLLYVPGPGRGPVEVVETFTRAGVRRFRDRDGTGKKAASGKVAIDYPGSLSGLVDQFGDPYRGPYLGGARTQLVTDPENFGAWTPVGTPVLTSGQADPFGGTAAYLIEDNDGASGESVIQTANFAGDGEKVFMVFVRQGTSGLSFFALRDSTAGVYRHLVLVTWSGGVPSLSSNLGAGALFTPINYGGGWWLVAATATGVVAANMNRIELSPVGTAGTATGTTYFFGANAWDAPYPSPYQGPGESPSVEEVLSVPINFGPPAVGEERTLLFTFQPDWPLNSFDGTAPGIFTFGGTGAFATDGKVCWDAHRITSSAGLTVRLNADEVGEANTGVLTLPASGPVKLLTQLRASGNDHVVYAEIGASNGTSAARTIAGRPWRAQTFHAGSRGNGSERGFLRPLNVLHARGRHTLAEMEAVK